MNFLISDILMIEMFYRKNGKFRSKKDSFVIILRILKDEKKGNGKNSPGLYRLK